MTDETTAALMERLLTQLETQTRWRNEELQRLRTEPNMALVMTQLADEFRESLAVLFNYSHVVWNNGKGQDDIQDVYSKILDSFEESYKKMLGVDYSPKIKRQYLFARQERQFHSEKLLDAIMNADPDKSDEG